MHNIFINDLKHRIVGAQIILESGLYKTRDEIIKTQEIIRKMKKIKSYISAFKDGIKPYK